MKGEVHNNEKGEMTRKSREEGENEMLGVGRYRWEGNFIYILTRLPTQTNIKHLFNT